MPTLTGLTQRQTGRKLLLATFSITNTATLYAIPATTAEFGRALPKMECLFMLQGNTDFYYRLAKTAVAGASSSNATRVMAFQQEFTSRELDDANFDVVTASGTGTLNVFLLVPGV